jgi:lipid II:glycine glycyltransferase (peptidoglycan interpeptide bridge formation enzyme)
MLKNNISIIDIEDVSDEEINKINLFIDELPNTSIFHTVEWNKCIRKIFNTKFQIGVLKNYGGKILSLIPYHVFKKSNNIINIYSPPAMFEIPYGGFLFGYEKNDLQKEVINNFLKYFTSQYKNCACFITGMPGSSITNSDSASKIRYLKTPIVNLAPTEDEIFASFNSKRRNMIRKAEKNNVEIIIGGAELLEDYYKMIISLYKKLNKPPLTIEYYSEILKTFYPSGMARILLSKYQDRFLSGGVFLKYKTTGYYWHGASFDNTPNLGQNELIQWEVIRLFKNEGCTKYDLVRVEEEKLPNIALFKMGFTNITEEYYDLYYATIKNKIVRKIYSIFN